jgi:hypothetical protein
MPKKVIEKGFIALRVGACGKSPTRFSHRLKKKAGLLAQISEPFLEVILN